MNPQSSSSFPVYPYPHPHPHAPHQGELYVQSRRHVPPHVSEQLQRIITQEMPIQHSTFFQALKYLPVATVDDQGHVWTTVLVLDDQAQASQGDKQKEKKDQETIRAVHNDNETSTVTGAGTPPSNRLQIMSDTVMKISISLGPQHTLHDDPFVQAVRQTSHMSPQDRFFAAVGVDFTNRRRNKVAGYILRSEFVWQQIQEEQQNEHLLLWLKTTQNMGNCPKYITVRDIKVVSPRPNKAVSLRVGPGTIASTGTVTGAGQLKHEQDSSNVLSDRAISLIHKASTVFVASTHISTTNDPTDVSDLGLNHRGGVPGFVRTYHEHGFTYLVIPDYSGNRFYQTLGNIQSHPNVGLVFPDFESGDLLHITGEAQNLYDKDAAGLMPRTSLVTRVKVTAAVYIEAAMNLESTGNELFSPYNPPVRYLTSELELHSNKTPGVRVQETTIKATIATLVTATSLTRNIATFTFSLSSPISYIPGDYAIFDFSDILDPGYAHMNEQFPQLLNDDLIRSWTISGSGSTTKTTVTIDGEGAPQTSIIQVTVKRKDGGYISGFLHAYMKSGNPLSQIQPRLIGVGGDFGCFRHETKIETENVCSDTRHITTSKMVWIAGGVGITPFMAMWKALVQNSHHTNKNNDINLSYEPNLDLSVLFSGRNDEIQLLEFFTVFQTPPTISLHMVGFQTGNRDDQPTHGFDYPIKRRRMALEDLKAIAEIETAQVYLCGPEGLLHSAQGYLKELEVKTDQIHKESFTF